MRKKRELNTAQSSAIWELLLCADIFDNRARQRLDYYYNSDGAPSNSGNPDDFLVIFKHVEIQSESNCDFWVAYQRYRIASHFFRAECRKSPNKEFHPCYYWCIHRLGGVSESMGLLKDAFTLFEEAYMGRLELLPEGHESTRKSKNGVKRMKNALGLD